MYTCENVDTIDKLGDRIFLFDNIKNLSFTEDLNSIVGAAGVTWTNAMLRVSNSSNSWYGLLNKVSLFAIERGIYTEMTFGTKYR